MDVWDWHWGFAALFAAPSLAFLIPGLFFQSPTPNNACIISPPSLVLIAHNA
jgi:hypothetical protein